jgi:signal transduction histidine kinase
VVIEVHNDGEPIPGDRLGKVFEPFWRRTAAREGLGLGLYICSQIAKSHGGRLTVRSATAQGTTFVARLPIRD